MHKLNKSGWSKQGASTCSKQHEFGFEKCMFFFKIRSKFEYRFIDCCCRLSQPSFLIYCNYGSLPAIRVFFVSAHSNKTLNIFIPTQEM